MSELVGVQEIIRNETELAAFLKKVHDDQRSLEAKHGQLVHSIERYYSLL